MHFSTAFFFSAFFMSTTNTVNIEEKKGNGKGKMCVIPIVAFFEYILSEILFLYILVLFKSSMEYYERYIVAPLVYKTI